MYYGDALYLTTDTMTVDTALQLSRLDTITVDTAFQLARQESQEEQRRLQQQQNGNADGRQHEKQEALHQQRQDIAKQQQHSPDFAGGNLLEYNRECWQLAKVLLSLIFEKLSICCERILCHYFQ